MLIKGQTHFAEFALQALTRANNYQGFFKRVIGKGKMGAKARSLGEFEMNHALKEGPEEIEKKSEKT